MGGINHQPCGEYLVKSTELSRALSLANARLNLGNVALEDLLLVELKGSPGTIDEIIVNLDGSLQALASAQQAVTGLRQQMDEIGYIDLPPLTTLDWEMIGESMIRQGQSDHQAWNVALKTIRTGGFYRMVDLFEARISQLISETSILRDQIKALETVARDGKVNLVLEENRNGNIRPQFACLYTSWTSFSQVFLASSLISTEIWYAFNRNGSLVAGAQMRAA